MLLDDLFNEERYRVIGKLGWGHFSTVWLAKDLLTHTTVALKIVKSEDRYFDAARDEVLLLRAIHQQGGSLGARHVIRLLDEFIHRGPNGDHLCMVFEALGSSLLGMMRANGWQGIRLAQVREMAKQLLLGLDHLHRVCGIIHTDLKPENVLMRDGDLLRILNSTKEEGFQLQIADFGNACWTHRHFTEDIQTRQYRAPEVILGLPYDTSADIWSLACLLWEMATGEFLFEPRSNTAAYSRDEEHLALMVELLGPIPRFLVTSAKHSRALFNRMGELRHIHNIGYCPMESILVKKHGIDEAEARGFADFLRQMLEWNNKRRPTALEFLHHPWLLCK